MNPGSENHAVYRFGVFEANSQTGEFLRKGVRVKLQEQPFQLLTLLLENPGEIVSRESVRQRLWTGDTFVDFDASLGVAVGKLREALGDDADNPRFIETIPRRGYRFIAPVERLRHQTHSFPSQDLKSVPFTAVSFRVLKYSRIALAILVCLGVAVAGAVFVFHLIPRNSPSAVEVSDPMSQPH
ncbi:MAG: winged helix-turn-helix domain-containing protein, partial [Candidatus Acidiferrales bacterium]